MLNINMADVMAVLQLIAPYLIAVAVVLLIGVVVMIAVRRRPKPQRVLIRGGAVIAMVLTAAIAANLVAFGPMSTIITLATGAGDVTEKTTKDALGVADQVVEEGIVLLQNDDALLPLDAGKQVNLFGWASANPAYAGAGSGGANKIFDFVDVVEGLENSGIAVNEELQDFYAAFTSERPEMSIEKQSWTLPEPPAETYSGELIQGAKDFSDTAVIVFSRLAGEGATDMPTDVSVASHDDNSPEYADFAEGEHYLQLSQTERDLVDLVTSNFGNVIVVLNSANPLEMGFVDEHPEIKSVLWAPGPGNAGFNALGGILAGDVNPSGRAADTFVYDMTTAPWWNNQVKRGYTNLAHMETEGMNAGVPEMFAPSFINYVEGIYVGYKYYETAAAEGLIDYDQTVQYPFGHGLSYTSFTQTMSPIVETDGELTFDVTVTNTGEVAGKDVVEVYYNPPYTNGGIEKSTANLIAFAKTGILEPGASETVSVAFRTEDMVSYDMAGAGGYALEAGDYAISINRDSHEVIASQVYSVATEVSYREQGRSTDELPPVNLFSDVAGDVTYLSRADGFANHDAAVAAPTSLELAEPYASEYHLNANYDHGAYLKADDEMPTTGADNGMELAELRGADFDDPRWEDLLDQATVDEMAHLIALAGFQTAAAPSVGLVRTVNSDGPAAINNNFTAKGSIAFPVAVMIASTWNQELAHEYGVMMGKMSRELGSTGWYAPAMNTHRVAFGARNYEYLSEDGVLAGSLAAQAVRGASSEGVFSFIKHFALYDSNGKMVSIWANEQSMREIYFKPFEISVKDGGATAVMMGWNFLGHRWVGERRSITESVLRGEWGFRGMALTDFFRDNGHGFMNADAALSGGVDAMLSTFAGGPNNAQDTSAPTTVIEMRRATKNIMYTVVNSGAYDEDASSQGLLPWQTTALVINGALVVLLVGYGVWTFRRSRKHAA